VTMSEQRRLFGTELRRRRTQAGLSLTDLAKLVHYSKSHLSKVETGVKPPSADLARQCDAALSCDGALSTLATPSAAPGAGAVPAPADETGLAAGPAGDRDEVWLLSLHMDNDDQFGVVSRRHVLAGGLAGLVLLPGVFAADQGIAGARPRPGIDDSTLGSFRTMFDELRRVGQHVSAPMLLPTLVTQTHTLRRLASRAGAAQRDAALRLASRFAEYTGWLAQESGDDERALWWTDRAVELAEAGGDPQMAAYAFVRRGLVSLYRSDADETVALARQAQSASDHPRIRGLAAQREAQGHALAGDSRACLRAIERAANLLATAGREEAPTLGTSHVSDPASLAEGWCLVDLGQPARATDVLSQAMAQVSHTAPRARTRYGVRLARAYANSGEIEQACVTVAPILEAHERIGSATVQIDLRHLARTLHRWRSHPGVGDTLLHLTAILSTANR
jgi:transcriptional regulator with XRE-family HTH domain